MERCVTGAIGNIAGTAGSIMDVYFASTWLSTFREQPGKSSLRKLRTSLGPPAKDSLYLTLD